jgi:hypothetical protein
MSDDHISTAIEQKRYEEFSVAPGLDTDAIVGSVLVIWTDSVITTLKSIDKKDWLHAFAAWNVRGLRREIPCSTEIRVTVESSDVMNAFLH